MAELCPLQSVRPEEMRDVLAHECAAWRRELGWDYSATSRLIARSVGSAGFSGYALRDGGRVAAYAFFLPDRTRALLGAAHALPEAEPERAVSRLVDRSIAHLVHGVEARRIESQFIFFGQDDPAPVFASWGLVAYPRQYLAAALEPVCGALAGRREEAALRPFRGSDLKAAAAVVYRSFVGSVDARMSDCYATLEGCEAFTEGVLSRTGCGQFDARASFLALLDGRPVGVVLLSRIAPDVGHVVQISVVPEAQGRGLGRALLHAGCEALRRRGVARLSLSVSVGNERARAWYLALGLEPVKDFAAYVWRA